MRCTQTYPAATTTISFAFRSSVEIVSFNCQKYIREYSHVAERVKIVLRCEDKLSTLLLSTLVLTINGRGGFEINREERVKLGGAE